MLYFNTVQSDTLALLKSLQSIPELCHTRLVGGTALALQLGHRMSIDLDLFGKIDSDSAALRIAFSKHSLPSIATHTSTHIFQFLIHSVQVDIVNYPYPWLADPVVNDGIALAGLSDIAAMKLSAITNRGSKKDFVDLFFLLNIYSLDAMLNLYKDKYPDGAIFNVIQSLTYFNDAENDPMPRLLAECQWDRVKQTIANNVREFLKGIRVNPCLLK